MYAATFPPVISNTADASKYLQASTLARHKIEQIRQVGYTHLNRTDLTQLGVIDTTQVNTNGPFSFTVADNLVNSGTKVGYFGPATNATGTIAIGRALPGQGSSAPTLAAANQVTVSITWSGGGTPKGSCVTQTVIVAP